ncbi:MAG: nucleotidyltransferase family protein [Gemmatales bacterium]|nr:nucleotidyltransferase family protein [Gemmatales bacterium]MCS7160266.1 nucleotidyltransferase family protein [Gemmatales bacterium]MDW8175466.1 nucleotidyltransferase family protein [Gemmatales bacterium]MDW8223402.1 nucleotidyltransferase family protein [Gemmatales bacterium]
MIVGLVPAAGRSSRFGSNKLLQRLGSQTVLEHVVRALRQGGASAVLVILSTANAQAAPCVEQAGATPVVLEHPTADMRETVEAGLWWWARQRGRAEAWLLCPADYPAISAEVVRQLIAAYRAGRRECVYVPTYQGRRGHPVLLDWSHVERLWQFPRPGGINAYVRQQRVVEVAVACAGILYDLDTVEDLARIRTLGEGSLQSATGVCDNATTPPQG